MTCDSSGSGRGRPQVTLTMHRELPILFKGSMVRAILDGRKTQTRRIINPQPGPTAKGVSYLTPGVGVGWREAPQGARQPLTADHSVRCPYGQPGDHLWVRENWRPEFYVPGRGSSFCIKYQADGAQAWLDQAREVFDPKRAERWRPSIHIPRWASRILVEVTGVRVERIQDITVEDALAEGIDLANSTVDWVVRERFQRLWDSTNGRPKPVYRKKKIDHYVSYPWEGEREVREHRGRSWYVVPNPWVWVVGFKVLQKQAEVEG